MQVTEILFYALPGFGYMAVGFQLLRRRTNYQDTLVPVHENLVTVR